MFLLPTPKNVFFIIYPWESMGPQNHTSSNSPLFFWGSNRWFLGIYPVTLYEARIQHLSGSLPDAFASSLGELWTSPPHEIQQSGMPRFDCKNRIHYQLKQPNQQPNRGWLCNNGVTILEGWKKGLNVWWCRSHLSPENRTFFVKKKWCLGKQKRQTREEPRRRTCWFWCQISVDSVVKICMGLERYTPWN